MKYSTLLRLLKQDGWFVVRQTGGHLIMRHHIKVNQVTVSFHGSKEMRKPLVRKILKDAEIETPKR
ncbi:MAG: type II toxin-antitoxin system HicA family toxin [Saprospiraceae bacterium]|nr:type II toxin-antitoxin system HicA family toxin [Candidatus Opimibacter skivensis]